MIKNAPDLAWVKSKALADVIIVYSNQKSADQNALRIYTFYASKHRKKASLLPIQSREGLAVISGGIFCLQACGSITWGLISGGGVGGAFNGGSLWYKNNRETNTHFFNKHILY